jgi:hypothetical protein
MSRRLTRGSLALAAEQPAVRPQTKNSSCHCYVEEVS